MSILASVGDYIDTLVHPAARQDTLAAARHRAFIASRLLGSFAALAAFPLYLTLRGVPGAAEIAVVVWLLAPMLVAFFLSRTGRYDSAHILSSLALTGLITTVAFNTGGLASFAAVWLVIVPLEATLSASRRVIATASVFALAATALLFALGALNLLPVAAVADQRLLTGLGVLSAALYAAGVALAGETFARTHSSGSTGEDASHLLARHMTDVVTRHGRNGAVLSVSPAAERLFGVKMRELLGHGLFDRVQVADRPAYLKALADAAADGVTRTVELRVRRGASENSRLGQVEFIWIEMRCRPIEDTAREAGAPRDVVAVLRDVSERKTQEGTFATEAENASAAKNRFVATMSHELRTPLNVIIGFSEMLLKDEPGTLDGGRREEYARLINESGHHLLAIVNSMLDMSKIEAGSFEITREPFALAPLVASCCELMALKASQAGVTLERRIADDMPDVLADERSVRQILLNLLSNAIKFTEEGGCVTVRAACEGPLAILEVVDTGVGIDPADLPRVGAPFFQARDSYDRKHEGTGLGLSIVKGLVKLHAGQLDIRSHLGKGTCVTVRLLVNNQGTRKTPAVHNAAGLPTNEPVTVDPQVKKIA